MRRSTRCAATATNQVTRFAYDADNRLRFTVDALGSVSESVYDAMGNVVVTTRFAARPTLVQYTESAIDVAVIRFARMTKFSTLRMTRRTSCASPYK